MFVCVIKIKKRIKQKQTCRVQLDECLQSNTTVVITSYWRLRLDATPVHYSHHRFTKKNGLRGNINKKSRSSRACVCTLSKKERRRPPTHTAAFLIFLSLFGIVRDSRWLWRSSEPYLKRQGRNEILYTSTHSLTLPPLLSFAFVGVSVDPNTVNKLSDVIVSHFLSLSATV